MFKDSLCIVILGSSTAAGFGSSIPDSSWVNRYQAHLQSLNTGNTIINLSLGGYTTYDIQPSSFIPPDNLPSPDSARNISQAIALRPSAIIVNLPSNDAARKYELAERAENYVRVANNALRAGIPFWLCTPQPRNMPDKQRRELILIRDWIKGTFRDKTLDFWNGIAENDGRIRYEFDSGDGVHLNDRGHRILFERVRDACIPEYLHQTRRIVNIPSRPRLGLQVLPYPVRNFVTFRIRTINSGAYTLSIKDLLGKEIRHLRGSASSGEFLRFFNPVGLHHGIYHVILQSGPDMISSRMLIIG
ncbi:MAG: SGNH/GDSL hydrolase family protein [Bacteroidetes bacterium]|nr:SGNH/GDSL hydrolase family protein [Bacteroidota bacterium]